MLAIDDRMRYTRSEIGKEAYCMANTLIQFRTDETSRTKAVIICEQLGIDLQTYLRMCISRLISENGVPFSMKVQDLSTNKGILALREMGRISAENGNAEMTLDEINDEIAEARKDIATKNGLGTVSMTHD